MSEKIFKEMNVEPSKEKLKEIDSKLKDFLNDLNERIKEQNVKVSVFVGGSYAKGTLVRKEVYDVDVFLRFDKKYDDNELSELTEELLKGVDGLKVVHGSRDYFQINKGEDLYFEIVPVREIKKPEEAVNVTDLSYSHVKYVKSKIKDVKILRDIKIAKVFCAANNCYGAESYVGGFSGYALELLIYYYKGFNKFLKSVVKSEEKIIIDIEKKYKNKQEILMEINSSKLQSPIVLVDPTFKERNVAAALREEVFEDFKKVAKEFLNNPSKDFFRKKKIDFDLEKQKAEKNNFDFIELEIETDRQEGDIAGSKLLKFYKHLLSETSFYFDIEKQGFEYNKEQKAKAFITGNKKSKVIYTGPYLNDKNNLKEFKKKHKNIYEEDSRIYANEKVNFDLKDFIKDWKKKNKDKISEMSIIELKID